MYIVRTICNYVTRCMAVCRKMGLTKIYAPLPDNSQMILIKELMFFLRKCIYYQKLIKGHPAQ